MNQHRLGIFLRIIAAALLTSLLFQNCQKVAVEDLSQGSLAPLGEVRDEEPLQPPLPDLEICERVSCTIDPIVQKPAVTLVLLALGDQADNQLVVDGASAQLVAETVIRQTSPVKNPKILLLIDANRDGEDLEDTEYAYNELLKSYEVTKLYEPAEGISVGQLLGYDLVWLNNPGHPMNSAQTMQALIEFKGGVVLQGDDLSRGRGFNLSELTKVSHVNNGTTALCDSEEVTIDNNSSEKYQITLESKFFPVLEGQPIKFDYGNDIDLISLLPESKVEVLATAKVKSVGCTQKRPVITRYLKN
jgi:hypothetical protein